MKKILIISAFVMYFPAMLMAKDAPYSAENVRDLLKTMFSDNADYVANLSREHFDEYREQQSPRATIVSCSDSRVQESNFHKSPVNDLFVVRNIGNQLESAEGSVEFGIEHLKTPVLLIIGHSYCGAIMASMKDYSKESRSIRHALDHLHGAKFKDVNEGVVQNVNRQVELAMEKFKTKIEKKELVVLGTVYDFRDDFGHGHGRLILINLNGMKDPQAIKKSDLVKGFDDIPVGIKVK